MKYPSSSQFTAAYFITPHGFGHAARAAAVMIEMLKLNPDAYFHIYTHVPEWFFAESGLHRYGYHPLQTDIGLAQLDAMHEDLEETLRRLGQFLPFPDELLAGLAREVNAFGCQIVLCDIAPLGIAVAERAGVPSALLENFTWDWIYRNYLAEQPAFGEYITQLRAMFSRATYHIQTSPACVPDPSALQVNPASRPLVTGRQAARKALRLPASMPAVLVTMGGMGSSALDLARMKSFRDAVFIIPGGSSQAHWEGNLLLLPHHHGIYHPDLVNACDCVIGKLGYSTFAECHTSGTAYGFIPRESFAESRPLADFALKFMNARSISEQEYLSGAWLETIPGLLAQPKNPSTEENGAAQAARFLLSVLKT